MNETEFEYDVFISYSHKDEDWVVNTLLPTLEAAGIKVCIDYRDFIGGAPSVKEMERAILESRKTLLVLTPDYISSKWADFEVTLAQTLSPANQDLRLLPLLKEKSDLPPRISYMVYIDFTRKDREELAWNKLFSTLGANPYKTFINEDDKDEEDRSDVFEPWMMEDASEVFHQRLCKAFPGLRDVEKYEGSEAVERLLILLKSPLDISLGSNNGRMVPFWWLRGYDNMYIDKFARLEPNQVLMNIEELTIDYIIAVRKFDRYSRNFVYVQVKPENPTGLYKYSENYIANYLQEHLNGLGCYYFYEVFARWEDKIINISEYEDGATILNGKVENIEGAEIRKIYITPYNFVICGQNHVFNKPIGNTDHELTNMLDEILRGTKTILDLIAIAEKLPLKSRF